MEFYYVNSNGTKLDLNAGEIRTISIDGLYPSANINMSSVSGYDGSTVVSSQMLPKNVVITLDLIRNVDDNRLVVYNIFRVKQWGTFYYKTESRTLKLEGITEKTLFLLNATNSEMQISLICPQPYFADLEPTSKIMSAVKQLFKFPFTFNGHFMFGERMASVIENFVNDSTVDIYPIVEFRAVTALTNPSIMNINTYEKMKVNVAMNAGDTIVIDARLGKKTIVKNGDINCFNFMADDFEFFMLYIGDNYLKYDADTNAAGLQTTVKWDNLYGGV